MHTCTSADARPKNARNARPSCAYASHTCAPCATGSFYPWRLLPSRGVAAGAALGRPRLSGSRGVASRPRGALPIGRDRRAPPRVRRHHGAAGRRERVADLRIVDELSRARELLSAHLATGRPTRSPALRRARRRLCRGALSASRRRPRLAHAHDRLQPAHRLRHHPLLG